MSMPVFPPITRGVIPATVVQQYLAENTITLDELMLALVPIAEALARPPLSHFQVGAVALGASGSLYLGANFEFPGEALSFTVHGEQACTVQAIAAGETGLQKLAISAAPCGYCRQFLYELTTASTLQILLPNTPPALLTSLLPDAFGPQDIGVKAALLSPQSHGMTLSSSGDTTVEAALAAANASYAPYSFGYAGIALKTRDGNLYSGSVAENAAFNPSMSPLEAAIVNLAISGNASYDDIVEAVLVEPAGSKASQAAVTRAVLKTISQVELHLHHAHLPPTP